MQRSLGFVFLALGLAVGLSSATLGGEGSTFERITGHYEEIRHALLHDSTEDVAVAAEQIQQLLQTLEATFNEKAAGILPGSENDLRALLPGAQAATANLIEAVTIADAREAFGALSKAMVRYRQLVGEPAPAVAFCSMAQKVWLQPNGEIGNPYYGQDMARCGEFVSE